MKLFGKEIFKHKQKERTLYDFAQHGLIKASGESTFSGYISFEPQAVQASKAKKPKGKIVEEKTPKQVYKLGSLNDNDFSIVSDTGYLEKEIANCQKKLNLLPKIYRDKASSNLYAANELESIIERLGNRKQIDAYKETLDKYPHTSSDLINKVLEENKHLRFVLPHSFIPDLPTEAIEAMNEYGRMCQELCSKDAVYYLIVDKKDVETRNARRDPILLAQSPFGFFWQILGAWDEEVIYLGDL